MLKLAGSGYCEFVAICLRNFFIHNAIQKAGIKVIADGGFPQRNVKKTIGGMSWILLALGTNSFPGNSVANTMFKGSSSSGGSFSIVAKVDRATGPTYFALYGKRYRDSRVICHLDVIKVKGAQLGQVTANAEYLSREIDQYGKASLYGISPKHLEAKGVGPLVPVLSNKADEGRGQNRRVELVEKQISRIIVAVFTIMDN